MQYLYSYNEEAKWSKSIRRFIKGYNKSDMYIMEPFEYVREDEIPKDLLFSGMPVSKSKVKSGDFSDIFVTDTSNKGVFVYKWGDYIFDKTNKTTLIENLKWYDQSYQFDKLNEISNSLGYKIGKSVKTVKGNSGKIEEIIKFAFYYVSQGTCIEALTLLYKVGKVYYQITQIELLDNDIENLVDETIKEHFYELLDDDIITYVSVESDVNIYDCKIIINKFSTNTLHQVSEYLLVAEGRLNDLGVSTEIKDITKIDGKYTIEFTCKRG
jgi:hypothetical protein